MAPKEAKKDGKADAGKKEGGKGGDKAKDGGKKEGDKGAKKDDKGAKKDDKGAKKDDGKKDAKAGEKKDAKATPAAAKPGGAAPATAGGADDKGDDEGRRRAPFRRFFYRGLEVDKLLDLSHSELMALMTSRVRRRFSRGQIPMGLVRKLRKEKSAAAKAGEKPKTIKTHHRNMIIVPEMVGSMVGVYNGLAFTQVEIKPDMIGHYLGEFSITYKPVKHGRAGAGPAAAPGKVAPLAKP